MLLFIQLPGMQNPRQLFLRLGRRSFPLLQTGLNRFENRSLVKD